MATIRSIGTALPPHRFPQADLAAFAHTVLAPEAAARLGEVFTNARIDERFLACPLEWYVTPHGHGERAAVYAEVGLALAEEATTSALATAGLAADDIEAIVFVSTTGHATPSLDARLCNRLSFRSDVRRVPVWGLGCAGGVAGLNRAADLARQLDGPVLLVSLELCSINLDFEAVFGGDGISMKSTVAAAVFGDGCAAAVLAPDGGGPRHVGGRSHIFPDTEWVMGWEVTDRNLEVVLSPKIPSIVEEHIAGLTAPLLEVAGIDRPDAWILHPGGAKVIDAYQAALGLSDDERAWSDDVLRRHGNMSGPTVLFCLAAYLEAHPHTGQDLLLAALGPGFASEMAMVRT